MAAFEAFFRDLDAAWDSRPLTLHLIGAAALMLQTDYRRGTKDSDVLETRSLAKADKERLLELGGQGTTLSAQHRLYIDVVGNGIPFLPHGPRFVACDVLNRNLRVLRVEVLEVVDLVVSKLKRFHANDQSDVAAMIELGLVPHDRFIERFRSAVDAFSMDARATELPTYLARLHRVERDIFGVALSNIDLPDWG